MESSAVVQCQRQDMHDHVAVGREWDDLPSELLPCIADRLGLIELLRFRGVSKDCNSASSTASAEIEALPDRKPWFLLYGEKNDSECTLVTGSGKKYIITIPEMDGAICLASIQGWLLLFREGSIFFFCPFSRARIELPVPSSLSHKEFFDHAAMFSAPPTSKDCVVCIICRIKNINDLELSDLELYTIHRGANSWSKHRLRSFPNKIYYAAYHDGIFYFFDNTNLMVCFSIEDQTISCGKVRYPESSNEKCLPLRFSSSREKMEMERRLASVLGEGSSVSTCGTIVPHHPVNTMIAYENTGKDIEPETRKGVWFQPRFHQIDEKLSW